MTTILIIVAAILLFWPSKKAKTERYRCEIRIETKFSVFWKPLADFSTLEDAKKFSQKAVNPGSLVRIIDERRGVIVYIY